MPLLAFNRTAMMDKKKNITMKGKMKPAEPQTRKLRKRKEDKRRRSEGPGRYALRKHAYLWMPTIAGPGEPLQHLH